MSDAFELRAVRLINWHNFVDETVPVSGSLFLIGDNGSGKTTLLDAIHCALTGDWKVELNAAARVGGRRDEGRSLAGVVLRYDVEKGFQRPAGAIAYAALELRRAGADGAGGVLSAGIGVYVASPDARPDRWGFLSPRPLAEVPLLLEDNGETPGRPADRTELQARLGAGQVLDVGRYRTRLGERLFGSRQNLEQVASFLQAGKAYRELVSRTTNFSELFSGLLPLPDVETFHEVRRALEAIERTRTDLAALDEELSRLRALIDWQEKVAQEREAVARYDYLAARHAREGAEEAVQAGRKKVEGARAALEETEKAISDAEVRSEALEEERERLRNSQGADLLRRLEEERARERREADEAERLAVRVEEARGAAAEAESDRTGTVRLVRETAGPLATATEGIGAAIATEVETSALEAVEQLGRTLRTLAAEPGTEPFPARDADGMRRRARQQVAARIATLRDEARRESELAAAAEEIAEEAEQRGDELRRRGEVEPPLAGIVAAVERLRAEGIDAVPLYRLLEPKRHVTLLAAGAIERALGRRLLGTLITSEANHGRARAILLASAPDVPIADPTPANGGTQGLDGAIEEGESVFGAVSVSRDHPIAESFLRHHTQRLLWLEEAPESREDFLTRDGHLHHRKFDERLSEGPATWLGERARKKALEDALEAYREEARAAGERARAHRDAARAVEARASQLRGVEEDLERLDLIGLGETVTHRDAALRRLEEVQKELLHRSAELERVRARLQELARTLEAMTREAEAHGLQNLARRMQEVEEQIRTLKAQLFEMVGRRGRQSQSVKHAEEALEDALRVASVRAEAFAAARQALLILVPPDHRHDLEDYVLRVRKGRQVKPENFEANRQACDRRIAALVERISHAEGIRHQLLWQKYAFQYDGALNRITDSTGKEVHEVTADLQARVDELTEVLRGRNEELLERVVLEELVGTLRGELGDLQSTVRDVNALLSDLRFGRSSYRIEARLKTDFRRLHDLLRRSSAIGAAAREELREYFSSRLEEFSTPSGDDLPPFLDYRRWYDFDLRVSTLDSEGVVLSRERLRQGSGGEQAVPSYLLLICLTKLLYDGIDAGARLLLLDEAFYGIDAGRRDELLRFTRRTGIQIVVATPEMDGVTEALDASTTVLIEKTQSSDVYLWDARFQRKEATFDDLEPSPGPLTVGAPRAGAEGTATASDAS